MAPDLPSTSIGNNSLPESPVLFTLAAAQQMRWILMDYARCRQATRRPERQFKVAPEEILALSACQPPDLLALDDALRDLEKLYPRSSQVVELRLFAGLTET